MPPENNYGQSGGNETMARWKNFRFSGKVIMCSVLFGFGLLLIGGLLLVIDSGDHEKESSNDGENEMEQVKAPMSYLGPVVMGIGGFTIIVGTIMCLIETKVLRRRNGDSSPLIATQEDSETALSQPRAQPTVTKKKHNHRRKSPSPANSKVSSNKISSNKPRRSPQSSPNSVSKNNAASANKNIQITGGQFLTPANSLVSNSSELPQNTRNAENESLESMVSFANSTETSYNVSEEFKTPENSFIASRSKLQDSKNDFNASVESSMRSFTNSLEVSCNVSGEFQTPPTSFEDGDAKIQRNMRFPREENSTLQTSVYESSSEAIFYSAEFATPDTLSDASTEVAAEVDDVPSTETGNIINVQSAVKSDAEINEQFTKVTTDDLILIEEPLVTSAAPDNSAIALPHSDPFVVHDLPDTKRNPVNTNEEAETESGFAQDFSTTLTEWAVESNTKKIEDGDAKSQTSINSKQVAAKDDHVASTETGNIINVQSAAKSDAEINEQFTKVSTNDLILIEEPLVTTSAAPSNSTIVLPNSGPFVVPELPEAERDPVNTDEEAERESGFAKDFSTTVTECAVKPNTKKIEVVDPILNDNTIKQNISEKSILEDNRVASSMEIDYSSPPKTENNSESVLLINNPESTQKQTSEEVQLLMESVESTSDRNSSQCALVKHDEFEAEKN